MLMRTWIATSVDSWAWMPTGNADDLDVERVRRALTISDVINGRPIIHRSFVDDREGWLGVPRGFFVDQGGMNGHVEWNVTRGETWPGSVSLEESDPVFSTQACRHAFNRISAALSCGEGAQALALVSDERSFLYVSLLLIRDMEMPTLVLVHDRSAIPLWLDALSAYLPDARVWSEGDDARHCHVAVLSADSARGLVSSGQFNVDCFGFLITPNLEKFDPLRWAGHVSGIRSAKRLGAMRPNAVWNDGIGNVFRYHLGDPVVFSDAPSLKPQVKRVRCSWSPPTGRANVQFLSLTQVSDILSTSAVYNGYVVEQICLALGAGRKIIVFSESVDHLRRIGCDLNGVDASVDFAVHGILGEDLFRACQADVILATYGFCKNLPDIPEVDTVFLASPVEDPSDAVAVALLDKAQKKSPIVVDMRSDFFPAAREAAQVRDDFYLRKFGVNDGS